MTFLKFYLTNTLPLLLFSIALVIFLLFIGDPIAMIFVWIVAGLNVVIMILRFVEFKRDGI